MKALRMATLALLLAAVALPAGATAGLAHPPAHTSSPPGTAVTDWDAIGSQAFTAAALSPAEGHTIFAYLGIAVYDSVVAVEGRHRPFAVDVHAPRGTSAPAAVAAAAHPVLAHYLPAQAPGIIDPAYATSLAAIPDGRAKAQGVALGEKVARRFLAKRSDDGFGVSVPYIVPDPPIPGVWIPTAATPPIGTYLPGMTPFTLRTTSQFRPSGPPSLSSARWARDYNEVKSLGSSTSTTRTAEQTLIARFWAEAPVQQAHNAYRKFVVDHQLNIVQAARFLAMVSVSIADAQFACFDAKYTYAFWRPITAIRAGDTDGNPATTADPTWSPLLPGTPNHPDYPSAHSCVTPAAGYAIASFLGTNHIDFTIPSLTGLGDRHFDTVLDLQNEVGNARIWAGIHFRSAIDAGVGIAKKAAHRVTDHYFERTWT